MDNFQARDEKAHSASRYGLRTAPLDAAVSELAQGGT